MECMKFHLMYVFLSIIFIIIKLYYIKCIKLKLIFYLFIIFKKERFKTNTMYTMEKKNDLVFGPQPRRHLEKTKAKQIKNEINLAQMKTTEARSMNGQTSNATLILNKSCGRAERLPEWRRQGLLTSTFPKA